MALSEEEARKLAQLEQLLAADDPDFASTLRGSKMAARNRKVAIIGGLTAVAGLALILTGAVTTTTWVGVIGFLVMIAGAYAFARAWQGGWSDSDDADQGRGPSAPKNGSFADRMEERWQRRTDGF